MPRGYYCFTETLTYGHYSVPLLIHKLLLKKNEEDVKHTASGSTNNKDFCMQSINDEDMV